MVGGVAARRIAAGRLSRGADVGVVCAMDEEIDRFRAAMKTLRTVTVSGNEIRVGTLAGKRICVARCGMGKVNAAVAAQTLIREFGCKRLINVGVAGGADPALLPGDLVVSTDAVQHDYHTIGCEPGRILYQNTAFFPANEKMLDAAVVAAAETEGVRLQKGRVATGDLFVEDASVRDRIRDAFHASVIEMEGAAVAQTAFDNQTPWLVLRAVADQANSASPETMQKNMALAMAHLFDVVERMLPKL